MASNGRSVLLVAHAGNIRRTEAALRQHGFEVVQTNDLARALNLARGHDVVIVHDLLTRGFSTWGSAMSVITYIEVLRRSAGPRPRIVVQATRCPGGTGLKRNTIGGEVSSPFESGWYPGEADSAVVHRMNTAFHW